MKPTRNVYIGTSGWHYAHWKGPFYPDNLSTCEMFHYTRQFKAVEVNNSFYRLSEKETLRLQ